MSVNFINEVNAIISKSLSKVEITTSPKAEEEITFIDNHIPTLEEGLYTLTTTQNISAHSSASYEKSQDFFVGGPRFALPPEDIHAVFPPSNSIGDHDLVLPHIAFHRISLPWEVANGEAGTPWFCLVLFNEKEVPEIRSMHLSNFLNKATKDFYDGTKKVSTITIPESIIGSITSQTSELYNLAHIRRILNNTGKTEEELSFVIGNRLPYSNSTNTVHLVSLKDTYSKGGKTHYISLYHWSFTCIEKEPVFHSLLEKGHLTSEDFGITSESSLNPYYEKGYVPMPHFLKGGEQTISLYHGPFLPLRMTKKLPAPVTGSKQFAYDRFIWYEQAKQADVSYVAAFQLGQLLTLANKQVANAIYDWKRKLYQNQKSMAVNEGESLPISKNSATPPLPTILQNWVIKIQQLQNIPFNYLIPYEALLPLNSFRFFKLDTEWIETMIEGAFSIGEEYSSQKPKISQQQYSGFLLRSEVVIDYPGMKVKGLDCTGNSLPVFFHRKLDENILLYCFEGLLSEVDLFLPPQVIHFGVESAGGGKFVKTKRNPQTGSFKGKPITLSCIDTANRVIDISQLKKELGLRVSKHSSDFAFQMIQSSPKVEFKI